MNFNLQFALKLTQNCLLIQIVFLLFSICGLEVFFSGVSNQGRQLKFKLDKTELVIK